VSNQIQPENNSDAIIHRRCRGRGCGRREHPLIDFAHKKARLCLECCGLTRAADGSIVVAPRPAPKPKRRRNAASYPTNIYEGYLRYARERHQRLRAEARAAAGKPPRQPSPLGAVCKRCPLGPDGKRPFLPRTKFTGLNTICDKCLADELARIEAQR
jgi:hypothetical protein